MLPPFPYTQHPFYGPRSYDNNSRICNDLGPDITLPALTAKPVYLYNWQLLRLPENPQKSFASADTAGRRLLIDRIWPWQHFEKTEEQYRVLEERLAKLFNSKSIAEKLQTAQEYKAEGLKYPDPDDILLNQEQDDDPLAIVEEPMSKQTQALLLPPAPPALSRRLELPPPPLAQAGPVLDEQDDNVSAGPTPPNSPGYSPPSSLSSPVAKDPLPQRVPSRSTHYVVGGLPPASSPEPSMVGKDNLEPQLQNLHARSRPSVLDGLPATRRSKPTLTIESHYTTPTAFKPGSMFDKYQSGAPSSSLSVSRTGTAFETAPTGREIFRTPQTVQQTQARAENASLKVPLWPCIEEAESRPYRASTLPPTSISRAPDMQPRSYSRGASVLSSSSQSVGRDAGGFHPFWDSRVQMNVEGIRKMNFHTEDDDGESEGDGDGDE